MNQTFYDILGVPCGASTAHIKDSYRLLSRKTLITDAVYEVLTDPARRQEYDIQLLSRKRVYAPLADRSSSPESANGNSANECPEQDVWDGWRELGASREFPAKSPIPSVVELQYIRGVQKLLESGVPLEGVSDSILASTPEQLLDVAGIHLETQTDATFLIEWVSWLADVVAWLNSLPANLARGIFESLDHANKDAFLSRYRFLTTLQVR